MKAYEQYEVNKEFFVYEPGITKWYGPYDTAQLISNKQELHSVENRTRIR